MQFLKILPPLLHLTNGWKRLSCILLLLGLGILFWSINSLTVIAEKHSIDMSTIVESQPASLVGALAVEQLKATGQYTGLQQVFTQALAGVHTSSSPTDRQSYYQQSYIKASNTNSGDLFGAIAVSGNTVVVGARNEASAATGVDGEQNDNSALNSGAVYVFVYGATGWSQQAYIKASNTDAGDLFGWFVAVDGDTLVVGAPAESSNAKGINGNQNDNSLPYAGAVYVFVRNETTWSQQAYLKASNSDLDDYFGWPVAIFGDTIVVGAHHEQSTSREINGNQDDNSAIGVGAAYIFERHGTSWSQQAYLKASNAEGGDYFGNAATIYENTVVIGAYVESSNATGVNGDQSNNSAFASGAAYVFVRNGTTWSQQAYLKGTGVFGAQFGAAVSIYRDTVVVGSYSEGAVNIFVRNQDNWSEQAHFAAGNFYQGISVSIFGNSLLFATTAGPFIDEILSDETAYLYVRNGSNWSLQDEITPDVGDAYDQFGLTLAITDDKIVVGAFGDDSNATGINGNPNDNSASRSGSVYIFFNTPAPTPPGFKFTKNISIFGISPICSSNSTLTVPLNTRIVYCYTIQNSDQFSLTTHTLVDSHLGVLLNEFSHEMQPNDNFFTTTTTVLTVTTTNIATWTANSSLYAATEQATVLPNPVAQAVTVAKVRISSDSDDQDSDTIPDNVEAADDIDQDNAPNFLDTDADNDGKLDIDEVGPDPLHPLDANNNNIPDYLESVPTALDESEESQRFQSYLPLIRR